MQDTISTEQSDGTTVYSWSEQGGWECSHGHFGEEMALTLYLDQVELATLMCTPEKLNFLIAGFLRSEGFIETLNDIALMRVCDEENVADVRLMQPKQLLPGKRILTSGCGGGVTFDSGDSLSPVTSGLRVEPSLLLAHMRAMLQAGDSNRAERGGVHVSALADDKQLLVVSRDVGRHNTLDKIWGECLFREIDTRGKILLTTGRLSSEMMIKSAKMGVPITVSLNSPTSRSVQLARELGITVVGYARGSKLSVYAHSERLGAS
jgi:FdhD protein